MKGQLKWRLKHPTAPTSREDTSERAGREVEYRLSTSVSQGLFLMNLLTAEEEREGCDGDSEWLGCEKIIIKHQASKGSTRLCGGEFTLTFQSINK